MGNGQKEIFNYTVGDYDTVASVATLSYVFIHLYKTWNHWVLTFFLDLWINPNITSAFLFESVVLDYTTVDV